MDVNLTRIRRGSTDWGDAMNENMKTVQAAFARLPEGDDEEDAPARVNAIDPPRDLRTIFGTAQALHNAIADGDFSQIRIGDYWTVTLNGQFLSGSYELKNEKVVFQVAALDPYYGCGDVETAVHGVIFAARNCLSKISKHGVESGSGNWMSSPLYKLLNGDDGLIKSMEQTDIGPYIYGGNDGKGMRYRSLRRWESENYTNRSEVEWISRGKLFVPYPREVDNACPVGEAHRDNKEGNFAVQWPIFDSMSARIKRLGEGGSRCYWKLAGGPTFISTSYVYYVIQEGEIAYSMANWESGILPCFMMC